MKLVGLFVALAAIVAVGYVAVKPGGAPAGWEEIVAARPDGFDLNYDRPQVPDTPFQSGGGAERSLTDYRGKVLVVNLWATWCAPCVAEMPSLDRLDGQFLGDDLDVIAISMDRGGVDAAQAFLTKLGTSNLAPLADPSSRLAMALDAPGLPTTIVIDRDGREIGRFMGAAEWDDPQTVAFLKAVVASKL